jgi:type IV pilus assembly protein PilY1
MNRSVFGSETPVERMGSKIACAALVTMATALPVQAGIVIPNKPPEVGAAVPPNIMMILDTSGSMTYRSLPNYDITLSGGGLSTSDDGDSVPVGGPDGTRELGNTTNVFDFDSGTYADVSFRTYTYNTLSYNPNVDYQPWTNSDGSLMASTPYSAVFDSGTLASGSTVNLSGYTPVFFAPKPGQTDANDITQYYRYQIRTDGKVVRSDRDSVSTTRTVIAGFPRSGLSAARNTWVAGTTGTTAPSNLATGLPAMVTVPVGAIEFKVTISGGDNNANLYVRQGALPTTSAYDCRPNLSNNAETCTFTFGTPLAAASNYYIGIRAGNGSSSDAFSNLQVSAEYTTGDPETGAASVGCDTTFTGWGWRHCTFATPTGRSEAAERQNYANWWSFYRTRNKAAKAGVTRAFSEIGGEYRVGLAGLTSIVNRIPVLTDGGLFRDRTTPTVSNNRSDWWSDLRAMPANGSTPLRSALARIGNYYSESAASDNPYRGTGGTTELSCRQNFAILTTDGYWNGSFSMTGLSGDEDAGTTITGPNSQTYTYSPVRPYRSNDADTLADVAMHYWKTDLRPQVAMENNVPATTTDPAFWQHMVTFGISLGLKGQLAAPADLPALTAGTKTWPTPSDGGDAENIDDLWHAAVNSRGKFVAATNPQQFAQALRSALAAVVERTASSSNVSANSATVSTDTLLFQAGYVTNRWIGELTAYAVTSTGASTVPSWRASENIPAAGSRNILTWSGSGGTDFPTSAQAAALNTPFAGVSDYIRGDQSGEIQNGGSFRDRSSLLGDIIHSSPYYSKDTNTVFVGANDGMLHAFDASNGEELFAYVPKGVAMADLKGLASDSYSHNYFVDGPLFVSTRDNAASKNYLVGAMGAGGKGVYGLDVTDTANFDAANVLWDFNATTTPEMGNVMGRPIIAKLNNGATAAIVANGPNSASEKAVLYILDVTNGSVIAAINTNVGSATTPNGLSTPVGWDDDADGDVDMVYAGDLLGNLWRFNIGDASPSNWTSASNRLILHSAKDSGALAQPIFGAPTVGVDPSTYKTWVFFGTGRLLNAEDLFDNLGNPNKNVQSWYGVLDEGVNIASRATLQERKVVAAGSIAGKVVRGFESYAALPAGKKGWFIDFKEPAVAPATGLVANGERVIGDSQIIGRNLFVSSIIPSSDGCGKPGRGYLNVIDAFTGSSVQHNFFDIDDDGQFSDDNVGGVPVGSVDINVAMPTGGLLIDDRLHLGGSGGNNASARVNLDGLRGRISWRELKKD